MLLQAVRREETLTLVQPATARAALNIYFYLVMQDAKGAGKGGGRGERV